VRVALYLRVNTSGQTVANQRQDLEAAAARHGWQVVAAFQDAGISGAKGRQKRPGLDNLLKAAARREVDLVAAWSVDRLGRSLQDLLGALSEIHAKGVDLYLHQQGIDTSTPAGRALFQISATAGPGDRGSQAGTTPRLGALRLRLLIGLAASIAVAIPPRPEAGSGNCGSEIRLRMASFGLDD
jgi:Resolvase, N terminal domain